MGGARKSLQMVTAAMKLLLLLFFINKGHIQTESEGLEKNISCKQRPKESKSRNTHITAFKIKAVKRDKEGHYIMIKESIQEEDITIINI